MQGMGPNDLPENEAGRQRAVQKSGAWEFRNDERLQRIVDYAAKEYRTHFGAISIISENSEIILSRYGMRFWEVSRSQSFCAVVVHRPGEPIIVGDASADPRFQNLEIVRSPPFVRFYAGMPIVDRNGYALGAVCVADPEPRAGEFDILPLAHCAREIESIIWR
jgi:GAF domain-containing protein